MKIKSIKCHFNNSRGNQLDARLDTPDETEPEPIKAFIIFCHCFTCSKETITTFRLSRLLAQHGYAVLRFDFTGLGDSEGEFSTSTFSSTQDDIRSAVAFLTTNYAEPKFVMGHSLGGTTALSIANEFPHIKGVVTIASPSEPDHVLHHFGAALTLLEQNINASFDVAGQPFEIEPGFVKDVRSFDMKTDLSDLDKPVMVINIEDDALVDETNSREIQQWVNGDVTYSNVIGSDHLRSDRKVTEKVAGDIVEWMNSVS
jgi:putative redox protein